MLDAMKKPKARMGRPPKRPEDRAVRFSLAFPGPLHRAVVKHAEAEGVPLSAFIAGCVARALARKRS